MNDFTDCWYTTQDGLTLYARQYAGPATPRLNIVCLHGLTRNSADFADLAGRLSETDRVLVIEQRGRGRSSYDANPERYAIPVYVDDTIGFIEQQQLAKPVLVGTSMGGIMAMTMARRAPDKYRGLVLNDVGPVIDPMGLKRIGGNVSKPAEVRNWADAIALARANNAAAFPDYGDDDWAEFTRRLFVEDAHGVPTLAYDPNISGSVNRAPAESAPADPWDSFDMLADVPILVIRGAHSDILSAATLDEMARRHPQLTAVTVSNRGHAPDLSEPAAQQAIDNFLEALAS